MDLREEFLYSQLQLQEACGFEGKVGVAQCLATMCSRASESELKLKVMAKGEVWMCVAGVWSQQILFGY